MNPTVLYDELCEEIWQFYEDNRRGLSEDFSNAGSRLTSPWLPPPPDRCGSQVRILFVGLSPKLLDDYSYATSLPEAKSKAKEYRYVTAGERQSIQLNYDPYYGPLLEMAGTLNPASGVWHQIKPGSKNYLVEFTDFCHFPAIRHKVLQRVYEAVPELRKHCRKILERELRLYKPPVVVANGKDTSLDMLEMHCKPPSPGFEQGKVIKSFMGIDGCNVHLFRFLGRMIQDHFNRNRVLDEFRRSVTNPDFLHS
jgi:hypothetical protein